MKYRLALVVAGNCVLRYDNDTGKGDHRRVDDVETAYSFVGMARPAGLVHAGVEQRELLRDDGLQG